MKKLASPQHPLRALVVSKNPIPGIDLGIHTSPLHFVPKEGSRGAEVFAYHYLTRRPAGPGFSPLTDLGVYKDTRHRLADFDLIAVYMAAEWVDRVEQPKPETFPIREMDLKKIPVKNMIYVTTDTEKVYLPLLTRLGHGDAQVIETNRNGHKIMGDILRTLRKTGSVVGVRR